jgi:hypothetical protein
MTNCSNSQSSLAPESIATDNRHRSAVIVDVNAKKRKRISPVPERRPWLRRKPSETMQECISRLHHSCYACGKYYADLIALDEHEKTHG